MYHLEKVPASSFKIMLAYIKTMQGESKARVIKEAKEFLENKDSVPQDLLEVQLIKEMPTVEESENLKTKIISAKIKRIEKVARLDE